VLRNDSKILHGPGRARGQSRQDGAGLPGFAVALATSQDRRPRHGTCCRTLPPLNRGPQRDPPYAWVTRSSEIGASGRADAIGAIHPAA
jgi:hypothetical protein